MNRAALFAAGATLAGVTACSSSTLVNDTDGGAHDAAAAGASGQSGADGSAGAGGQTVIAIYSAAFPPSNRS